MHVEQGRRSFPMPLVSTPIFERDSGSRMQTPHISVRFVQICLELLTSKDNKWFDVRKKRMARASCQSLNS
ncbi:hypothetical protein LINPERPRIM_LOCUS38449 [Linum perenne]